MSRWRHAGVAAVLFALLFINLLSTPVASAASLQISPLRYDAELTQGEKKKGFVDVTNPKTSAVVVRLSVQAFRQIDNNGSLEFYDSETIQKGILLDYEEVEIGPRETLHLAFLLDGTKLASGDNFAALFASTIPEEQGAGEQTVRVGTLLIIQNDTPSAHEAVIEDLSGSLLQFSDGLRVSFAVRNTAPAEQMTGFSPTITVKAWPYISDTVTGPLVFAGKSRTVDYVKKGNYLGLLPVKVKTGASEKVTYQLVITGYWRLLVPILLVALGIATWFARYVKKAAR